jgi:hypothetical protein
LIIANLFSFSSFGLRFQQFPGAVFGAHPNFHRAHFRSFLNRLV